MDVTLIMSLIHNIFEVSNIKEKDFLLKYNHEIMNSLKTLTVNRSLQNDNEYKNKYYEENYRMYINDSFCFFIN